jgi:hypothetical protein
MNVVITEEYNVMVSSKELISATEGLLWTRGRIKRRRYIHVPLYVSIHSSHIFEK